MMRIRLRPLLFAAIGGIVPGLMAQPGSYSTQDKGAIKKYEAGVECMRQQRYECAQNELTKAAAADPKFIEPRIVLAQMAEDMGRDAEAMAHYREVIAISPRFFPSAMLHLADLEFRNGQYPEAKKHYSAYFDLEQEPERKARARLGLVNCEFAAEAITRPVPFEPQNLGPNVNTPKGEYYPCITADDGTLMFTRMVDEPSAYGGIQEDFFVTRREVGGEWGASSPVGAINTHANEGAGTLSPDGRFMIFTKSEEEDGYGEGLTGFGSCDLFISRRIGNRWSPPENLGPPINSRNWETQPSLASDGRTLYFTRGMVYNRQIDPTSVDIYVSTLQSNGQFSVPEKLGERVNTPFREESAQIHPDGRTLYFSSNGHPGFGGLDIYVSRKLDDGTWGQALNLGYPINTGADENSLLVNASGEVAYFASDRAGGMGDLDLYSFPLYPEARPMAVSYIRGKVTDKVTGEPVEADVELYDLETAKLTTGAYSDPKTGEFLVCLPSGKRYALNAGSSGYLFFSENYDVAAGTPKEPITLNVPLSPITTGSVISLRNIFFNTASHDLLPASNAELDKLVQLLKMNPALRIELGGHTDDVGADAANMTLSDNRAKAVRDFVVAQGIDAGRITAKGYGETKPVAPNDSEQGRAQNRRTEVTVL